MKASAKISKAIHDEFKDAFTGIGLFFKLQELYHHMPKKEPNHTKHP